MLFEEIVWEIVLRKSIGNKSFKPVEKILLSEQNIELIVLFF